jgi:hypothetical protein
MRIRPRLLAAAVAAAALAVPSAAAAAPPLNDAYLASLPVDNAEFTATVDTTEATTQADLFNPSSTGQPLGGGKPEPVVCQGTPFGKTVWYDLAPQADGDVAIRATGFPTVVAVYQWSESTSEITRLVDCSLTAATDDMVVSVKARRNYTIQVGGAGGVGGPLNLKVEYFPDRDGDGVFDPIDDCPTTAGIGNGGCPPELRARARVSVDYTSTGVIINRLWVERVAKGAKIVARCGGCGSQTVKAKRRGVVDLGKLTGRAVNAGSTISVRVTLRRQKKGKFRYGATGKYTRWKVKAGGLGSTLDRCINVKSGKIERCR